MPRFAWLTPPAPAAIAMVRVDVVPGLVRRWPEPGRAGFARLHDRAGAVVDESVVLRLCEERADLCVHGGPGMRAAVSACLAGHGLTADVEPADDPRWRALAAAPSPAALAWLLANPDVRPPFAADFLRRPPLVLISGPANAGKSTLLNAWCGHRRALVSDLPGTTRDLVAAEALVAGWRIRLLDSAGLRPSDDPVERAGQDLVERARATADLVLVLAPADRPDGGWARPGDLAVRGKADLGAAVDGLRWSDRGVAGATVAELLAGLGAAVLARLGLPAGPGHPSG